MSNHFRIIVILLLVIGSVWYLAHPSDKTEVCDILSPGTGKFHAGPQIPESEVIEVRLPLRNPSDQPVSVVVNAVSCSCTKVSRESLTLGAGETYLLPFKINVTSKYGLNQVSLGLEINHRIQKPILVSYVVTRLFEWDRPDSIPNFPMQAGYCSQRTLLVHQQFHQGKPIYLASDSPDVKIEKFQEVGENGKYRRYLVDLTYLPHAQEGNYVSRLTMTNGQGKAEASFPYQVINMYVWSPQTHFFMAGGDDQGEIVLKRIDGKPFAISQVTQAPGLGVSCSMSTSARSHRIRLSVDKKVPFAERKVDIEVKTDAPDQTAVQFSCYFVNQENVTNPRR